MANHSKTLTIAEVDQKILSNDLYNDTDNAGIDKWLDAAIAGKINSCWKRFHRHWSDVLMNDPSFTDPIPSNKSDFVDLILARPDYKNRKTREDEKSL